MEETELIQRARKLDAAAWEELVRDHQQAIFRLTYLTLGDAAEAEDAAQETFVRAWRALPRFDATRPLRPWLMRIALNLARNRARSRGRYWAALQRSALAEPEAITSIEGRAAESEQARELWQAIRRLGSADQEVIYLRYFLEYSVEETAAALNVASGTIKSRLSRALGRLQDVIGREFPGLRDIE